MSESTYEAMRAYVRAVVELEYAKRNPETRSAPEPVDIVDLERRVWERIEPKLPVLPKIITEKGDPGDPGKPGKDGIATREELKAAAQEVFADFQVRTFADVYQGVYEPSRTYGRGLLTTWGGSLWLSKADTKSKPGENLDWTLIVKRGADGKK